MECIRLAAHRHNTSRPLVTAWSYLHRYGLLYRRHLLAMQVHQCCRGRVDCGILLPLSVLLWMPRNDYRNLGISCCWAAMPRCEHTHSADRSSLSLLLTYKAWFQSWCWLCRCIRPCSWALFWWSMMKLMIDNVKLKHTPPARQAPSDFGTDTCTFGWYLDTSSCHIQHLKDMMLVLSWFLCMSDNSSN